MHGGTSHARPGSQCDAARAALRWPQPRAGFVPCGPAAMPGQPGDARSLGRVGARLAEPRGCWAAQVWDEKTSARMVNEVRTRDARCWERMP